MLNGTKLAVVGVIDDEASSLSKISEESGTARSSITNPSTPNIETSIKFNKPEANQSLEEQQANFAFTQPISREHAIEVISTANFDVQERVMEYSPMKSKIVYLSVLKNRALFGINSLFSK